MVRIRIEYCIYLSRKLLVIFKCKINLGKKIKKLKYYLSNTPILILSKIQCYLI